MRIRVPKWFGPVVLAVVAVTLLMTAPLPMVGSASANRCGSFNPDQCPPPSSQTDLIEKVAAELIPTGSVPSGSPGAQAQPTAVPTAVPTVAAPPVKVTPTTGGMFVFDPNLLFGLFAGFGAIGWGLRLRKK